jgi:hypothetical protein
MEMDCYPEYKHHIHPSQHYGNNAAAAPNHPYYPGNYGAASMRYSHAHPTYSEGGQPPSYFEGYPRYTPSQLHQQQQQQHHHHHGNYPTSFNGHYGPARENYHASGEGSGQFYYQNAHQTSASYYGNHSYDSYRNASSNYQYHYGGGYHQSPPSSSSTPTAAAHPTPQQQQQQYYSSAYNSEQFNNRYYPTPPPSAPPRDPYASSSLSSSYASSIENESNEKLSNNERLSIEADKSSSNDPVALSPSPSSPAKQSTENVENAEIEKKPEVQQTESEKSSPPHESESAPPIKSEKANEENASEGVKVDGNLDSEEKEQKVVKHENQHQQSTSLFNENRGSSGVDHNQHQTNENSGKANDANSQESAAASDVENSAIATGKLKNTHTFSELSISTEEKRRRKEKKTVLFVSLFLCRSIVFFPIAKHAIKSSSFCPLLISLSLQSH